MSKRINLTMLNAALRRREQEAKAAEAKREHNVRYLARVMTVGESYVHGSMLGSTLWAGEPRPHESDGALKPLGTNCPHEGTHPLFKRVRSIRSRGARKTLNSLPRRVSVEEYNG